MVDKVQITAGLRIGYWKPVYPRTPDGPFQCVGIYTGPSLGNRTPGERLEQRLMEGTLEFKVGVLFRPDLGSRQRLETILIVDKIIEEMFEYEDWEQVTG